jgi:hypothetical protein
VGSGPAQEARQRNSLLTVELLGLGAATDDNSCDETQRRDGKCPPSSTPCSTEQKANGTCKPSSPAK